uniref:Peptidase S1 domain-containing protein n=1 Tax=Arion vulgaris TaxID=1028688 RepID=A0A0B6ZTR3_9EUPU
MPVFEHTRTGSDLATLQNEENHARADFIEHKMIRCEKHPGHREFFPINDLSTQHLPHNYQRQEWVDFIKLKSEETVLIEVNFTSYDRPDEFGLANIRGKTIKRIGSGTAFIMNMDKTEDCYCLEIPAAHKVSGYFHVMTVAHVVFDDIEAQHTVIKFFHDDDKDKSAIVTARGVRVAYVDIQRNRSIIECRTHDLTLCQRLVNARKKREILIQESLSSLVNYEPIVLLISHPHGLSKRVSTGKLLNIQQEGEVKTTKDGVELIGCILTYDTPTCPGTGGGSINLIGHGEVCLAFAPHCASKGDGQNISGLGWTKYVKSMQLRVSY